MKRIMDLHISGSALSTMTRCLKGPCSSVQTVILKFKEHGDVQPSYSLGKRVQCLRVERALVRNVCIRTKAKHLVKMLAKAGQRESLPTVTLYQHALKGNELLL